MIIYSKENHWENFITVINFNYFIIFIEINLFIETEFVYFSINNKIFVLVFNIFFF